MKELIRGNLRYIRWIPLSFFLSDASPFYTFSSLLLFLLLGGSAMRDGMCGVRDSQRMFGPRCDAYMGKETRILRGGPEL